MKPTVALFLPSGVLQRMFCEDDLNRLRQFATVGAVAMSEGGAIDLSALASASVFITGWGTPAIDERILDHAPRLKLIAHSAGTVKQMVSEAVYDRGIRVCTAASANAVPVAEFTVAMMVSLLKQVPWISAAYARGDQEEVRRRAAVGRELADLCVGIVGASRIGRLVIHMLRSFHNLTVKLYDPHITAGQASELGVIKSSLEEVCACDVVSIHAPNLPETHHVINARMLSLLPDHAVFINTARGALVDEAALVAELSKRPLYAALDVTDPEPPGLDSPLRSAPNLVLTPHIAGAMNQACRSMGKLAIDETIRFLQGDPLEHEVSRAMFATQA
jgi:phosphoglycerate dehydrogenase-like enzyme